MRVVQVLPTYAFGDAVGNDVTTIRKILQSIGADECVYAETVDKRVATKGVHDFEKDSLESLSPDDVLIYHSAIFFNQLSCIGRARCKKVMIYHNVTPADFYTAYDLASYAACRTGVDQVKSSKGMFDYVLADSSFNREDLRSYGYRCPIDVLPILIPYEDYRREPSQDVINRWRGTPGHNIVFVGRVAPNKCFEDVIAAFALYRRHYDPEAKLILVGSTGISRYRDRLDAYVEALGVEGVTFTGHVPFADILAYYTIADAFVCMSEHEGFCVPLVEAMLFDVPVVAYDACAVPDTLGAGGLLLEEKNPLLAAGAIDRVVSDGALRERILAGQREQLERFSYDRVRSEFLDLMGKFFKEGA